MIGTDINPAKHYIHMTERHYRQVLLDEEQSIEYGYTKECLTNAVSKVDGRHVTGEPMSEDLRHTVGYVDDSHYEEGVGIIIDCEIHDALIRDYLRNYGAKIVPVITSDCSTETILDIPSVFVSWSPSEIVGEQLET